MVIGTMEYTGKWNPTGNAAVAVTKTATGIEVRAISIESMQSWMLDAFEAFGDTLCISVNGETYAVEPSRDEEEEPYVIVKW